MESASLWGHLRGPWFFPDHSSLVRFLWELMWHLFYSCEISKASEVKKALNFDTGYFFIFGWLGLPSSMLLSLSSIPYFHRPASFLFVFFFVISPSKLTARVTALRILPNLCMFPFMVDQIGFLVLYNVYAALRADPTILISLFLFGGLCYSYNMCSMPFWICGPMSCI